MYMYTQSLCIHYTMHEHVHPHANRYCFWVKVTLMTSQDMFLISRYPTGSVHAYNKTCCEFIVVFSISCMSECMYLCTPAYLYMQLHVHVYITFLSPFLLPHSFLHLSLPLHLPPPPTNSLQGSIIETIHDLLGELELRYTHVHVHGLL